MSRVLVIAPHPDDETLGCGGTLLRHRADGDEITWLIVTAMTPELGYSVDEVAEREQVVDAVARHLRVARTIKLGQPTSLLDTLPIAKLSGEIGAAIAEVEPDVVYLPFRGDEHTDHQAVSDAAGMALKWYRAGSVRRVLAYETLSETDHALQPAGEPFVPNTYVDISAHIDGKVAAMGLYAREMGDFPFPRSDEAIRALATLRGSQCGCGAAEAFVLLREIR